MTHTDLALKLRAFADKAIGDSDGVWRMLTNHADMIAWNTKTDVGAASILVRADLCKMADKLETKARELREWARQIGEE